MILSLKDLKPGRNRFWKTFPPEELSLQENGEFALLEPGVETEILAIRTRNTVELRISACYRLRMTCARCLEPFEQAFSETSAYYVRVGTEELEEEKVLTEEDIFTLYVPVEEIDTAPLVREIVLLAVPMKPLCREDCKGLCPVCGTNLNHEDCGHRQQVVDPRWAKLLDLKKLVGG